MPEVAAFAAKYDFEVLDVHHHIGSAMGSLGWGGRPSEELPEDQERFGRLRMMNEGGVRQAIIQPPHNYLRPNGSPTRETSMTPLRPTETRTRTVSPRPWGWSSPKTARWHWKR